MPVMSRLGPSTDFGFPAECWSTVVQEPPRPRIHSVSELRMLDPQTSTYLWLWSYWWSSRSTLPQIPGWLQQTLLTSSDYWFTPDGSHKLISSSNYAPSLLFDPRISASCSAPKFDSRRTGVVNVSLVGLAITWISTGYAQYLSGLCSSVSALQFNKTKVKNSLDTLADPLSNMVDMSPHLCLNSWRSNNSNPPTTLRSVGASSRISLAPRRLGYPRQRFQPSSHICIM